MTQATSPLRIRPTRLCSHTVRPALAAVFAVTMLTNPGLAGAQVRTAPFLQRAIQREVARVWQSPGPTAPLAGQESWPVRHPVLMGTAIGAPMGLAIQASQCMDCWFLTGAMAGAGAYGGLVASPIHTVRQGRPMPHKVALVTGGLAAIAVIGYAASGSWSQ